MFAHNSTEAQKLAGWQEGCLCHRWQCTPFLRSKG